MKRRYLLLTGTTLALLWTVPAQAQSPGFSLGVKAGTLGAGLEGNLELSEWCGLRLGANAMQFSMNETVDNVDYDADLRLRNATALLDLYPFQGVFRLTGGVMYNANEFELEGRSSIPAVINGHAYTPAELGTLSGKAEFNSWAPYAGLGWSSRLGEEAGWGVAFDLGVVFQGHPQVTSLSASGTYANNPQLQADLERERVKVEDEFDGLKYYPVVSLIVHYNF
ncbi:MAG: hypothetical protein BWK76_16985 [Desulfobulbaceae bacterium A2]|nr:MAG: hypothetical protein BWK76_16985 [Desulfobulbaceae bacterium A2]